MNRAEIFKTVKNHLLTQNAQARSTEGGYSYESIEGLRCAIGCLIPDGHPALKYGKRVGHLIHSYPDLAELWGVESQDDIRFLTRLQEIHDKFSPFQWGYVLKDFEAEILIS